jgi:hypothetical protein
VLDEAGIKNLFFEWEFISLTEQDIHIKWVILARKRVWSEPVAEMKTYAVSQMRLSPGQ